MLPIITAIVVGAVAKVVVVTLYDFTFALVQHVGHQIWKSTHLRLRAAVKSLAVRLKHLDVLARLGRVSAVGMLRNCAGSAEKLKTCVTAFTTSGITETATSIPDCAPMLW